MSAFFVFCLVLFIFYYVCELLNKSIEVVVVIVVIVIIVVVVLVVVNICVKVGNTNRQVLLEGNLHKTQ